MKRITLARPSRLCEALVVIDGFPGCGKTMLSAIVASLDRVELLKYSYEIEQASIMHDFGLISLDTASQMVRYQLDLSLYNVMMSRDVNFRVSDLSSVFNTKRRLRYFKRLVRAGDEVVPERISLERPILHLATHCLSAFLEPMAAGGPDGMLFISMHRHPLFMLKQNMWNMENLIGNARHFALYYQWKELALPFYFLGQEERMIEAPPKEKAIFLVEWLRRRSVQRLAQATGPRLYELTFESLVRDPGPHIAAICNRLRTSGTGSTARVLRKERIPRTLLSDGRARAIYRRVGWQKTQTRTPEDEFDAIKKWAYEGISDEARQSLDWLCEDHQMLVDRLSLGV